VVSSTHLLHIDFTSSPDNYGNSVGGTLDALCGLGNLSTVLLAYNNITGIIPDCIQSLANAKVLYLINNAIQGSMVVGLCSLHRLEHLHLSDNTLTGTLPSCLGSLSQLIGLDLSLNQFHGPIPKEICEANALENLFLYGNALTGIVPSCLGSFSQLTELELNQNYFHGTVPEELCQASALKFLQISDNSLTGSLPSCLATSLLFLEAMLLYNNDLTGTLPSEWASPSLMSIMLSNNPKLSGSLPPTLFLQQAASNATQGSIIPNMVLSAMVIEGTSIRGTLPSALCVAPQLFTLALSGNKLTGSLPDCIVSLQNLKTLRISNNYLTGTLPVDINNMTSLTVLDLSINLIEGRVPAGLGDISQNLGTMHLELNRLSCDLPASVLDWQAASANISFNLLDGNLFSCGTNVVFFALSIQGAAGLRNANEVAFDTYSCGNSNYVLPVITVAILAVPVVVAIAIINLRGRLALQWRAALEWTVNPSTLINELDHADQQIKALALGVMAAAIVAGSATLVLSLKVASSAFECEYMTAPTLANKGGGDERRLSIGIGAAICAGLVLGLAPWWRRLVAKCCCRANGYDSFVTENNKPFQSLEEEADAWGFDAERMAEATHQKPTEGIVRALKLIVLVITLVIVGVCPNYGYVWVVLSKKLTQQQKVASEVAVTLAKTAIGTLLVPSLARNAVDLLVLNGALTFTRFRLRMAIATVFSAMTIIVLPVSIVLVTDKRCLFYASNPHPAVDTNVPFSSCSIASSSSLCAKNTTITFTSTYTPRFSYNGDVCVSAVLSVYGPIFLGVVPLTATLPAGLETFIVPWLAPWCYQKAESSSVARVGLAFLRAVTWNVWPALVNAGVLPPEFSLGAAKLDYLAQRVVERAFVQMMTTLLVALTFGIAMPGVGRACAVAAFVKLLHHRHVLGQIVGLGRLEQPAVVPNLMGCTEIPYDCALVVVVTVVLVWVCGTVGYLEPAVIGCMLLIGLVVALAAFSGVIWWRRYRSKAPRQEDKAQIIASSESSQDMLMESLLIEDENTKISEST